MNQTAHLLFIRLHEEFINCRQEINCLAKHECCFRLAEKYWNHLKSHLIEHEFNTLWDEVLFFKEIKPLFTGEIAYRKLVVCSLLFVPPEDHTDLLQQYWKRELRRYKQFRKQFAWFCRYYEQGQRSKDEVWFVRKAGNCVNHRTASSHDHLIGQYFALQKFTIYARLKLRKAFSM